MAGWTRPSADSGGQGRPARGFMFICQSTQHYIVRPPSMINAWPVIILASQARNVIASATSSVVDARCNGVILMAASTIFGRSASHREMITPGQTALTRISGASDLASDLVIVIIAPFDAA